MEEAYSDVWSLDMEKIERLRNGEVLEEKNLWQKINATGDGPEKISNHTGVVIDNRIYIYGGLIGNENVKNSLYSFDPFNNAWSQHFAKVKII